MRRLKFLLSLLFIVGTSFSCEHSDPQVEDDLKEVYRFEGNLLIDGYSRFYLLNLPPHYYDESTDFPLVIALHGTGGSALQCERDYRLTEKANSENYIIVYPEGIKNNGFLGIRTWNAGNCCDFAAQNNINDVGFISSLIDKLIISFKIDPRKVYVTGMSNGAMMAYRLACEIPDKIAAIAAVSGTMVTTSPSRPVPVLHIHSEPDTKVPPQGGYGLAGYYFPPVDSVLKIWALTNNCGSDKPVETSFENYTKYQWLNCYNSVHIEYYLTKDGGHAWPGGIKSRVGADTPSKAIDANEIIWDFFQECILF